MRTVLICLLQLAVLTATAQRECTSAQYHVEQREFNNKLHQQSFAGVSDRLFNQVTGASNGTHKTPAGVIRIPVVVHILYNNAADAISDQLVHSQIAALNRDFRKANADTSKTPSYFKPLAADIEIEFVLATADPKGRATTGIIRKQTSTKEWAMDDKMKFTSSGGSNAWDTKSYLNIWVTPVKRILGYSSEPGSALDKDGVVISPSAFGVTGSGAFGLGRTATHEVGHWLGLKHIWGDAYCGDDLVSDTPPQSTFTSGCPSGIRKTCNNGPNGDMYMNFMDFVNDECMNLFTIGQKNRMRSLFDDRGARASLLSSKGLHEPWVEESELPEEPLEEKPATVPAKAHIYPNPVAAELQLVAEDNWIGKEVFLMNMNGVNIQRILISNKVQKIQVANLPKGIYFIKGENNGQRMYEKIVKL
jgi:hypothetical protein